MLKIRKQQKLILDAHMREVYIRKTLANLLSLFPGDPEVQDEHAMRQLIEEGLRRSKDYGISREREASLYIYLMKSYGVDFDRDVKRRWIRAILVDGELDQEQKLNLIYQRLEVLEEKGAKGS